VTSRIFQPVLDTRPWSMTLVHSPWYSSFVLNTCPLFLILVLNARPLSFILVLCTLILFLGPRYSFFVLNTHFLFVILIRGELSSVIYFVLRYLFIVIFFWLSISLFFSLAFLAHTQHNQINSSFDTFPYHTFRLDMRSSGVVLLILG